MSLHPQIPDKFSMFHCRSNYIAAHYAANMMVKRNSGLIVNISSAGGLRYLFNIPYGVGKEAVRSNVVIPNLA